MAATVVGVLKSGKIELLEEPQGVPDGRVRVTIEEDTQQHSAAAASHHHVFLRLPLSERRRILREQAEKMVAHYQEDGEWREWLAGDIVEY